MVRVSFVKVKDSGDCPSDVYDAVEQAMNLGDWKRYVYGKKIFVKINAVNHLLVPGSNTSPYVIDAMLAILKKKLPCSKIVVGDSDTIGRANVDVALTVWGYDRILKKYGLKYVNLSNDSNVVAHLDGKFIKNWPVPKTVLDADCIISLPVIKTHLCARLSCALKNQVGCVLGNKLLLHKDINNAVADINCFLKPSFTLIDGTIGMEGNGPITGQPKLTDIIIASNDLVAADTAVSDFIGGVRPEYLKLCEKRGFGSMDYSVIGDSFFKCPYAPAKIGLSGMVEKLLTGTALGRIVVKSRMVKLLSRIATSQLNRWYEQNQIQISTAITNSRHCRFYRQNERL